MSSREYEASQAQQTKDSNSPLHTQLDSPIDRADVAWKTLNLLSLDGGGIRSYWTLLALRKLIEFIAEHEEQDDDGIYHSFSPEKWPENVSQVPPTREEKKKIDDASGLEARCREVSSAQRYLPCHYFDYICGSSTGGLIAIMLGRLRMTVLDCIKEYESLGETIFEKPRFFFTLRFGLGNRTKYDAMRAKKAFQDLTDRRNEKICETRIRTIFPSQRGLCRTFVTTLKADLDQKAVAPLYLIRSYDHHQRVLPDQSGERMRKMLVRTTSSNPGRSEKSSIGDRGKWKQSRRINYENAQEFELWEVARATTAAPFYFKPFRIKNLHSKGYSIFTDTSFNYSTNPTVEGAREIEEAFGVSSLGVVVSIGTARQDERPKERRLLPIISKLKALAQTASDPEIVQRDMKEKSVRNGISYFRLNDPGGLDIKLDEWKPKSKFSYNVAGSTTIETIQNAFAAWAMEIPNINRLKDCAASLVRCRRTRTSNAARWERYATGARFRCRFTGCEIEENFDREQFRTHLIRDHQIMEDIRLDEEMRICRKNWRYRAANGN